MRVAVYAPTPHGGHPEYVGALLTAMAAACPDASLTWPARPDADRRVPEGGPIDRPAVLPVMAERADLSRAAWLRRRLAPSARHDTAFLAWLARHRRAFDLVLLEEYEQATLPLLVWASRLLGLRVAVHVHNVTPHGFRGTVRERLLLRIARLGIRGAAVVGVHSESNAEAARRLLRPRCPVRVIPHGLRPRRPAAAPDDGPPRYVFFGTYRTNKGLDVLAEALQALPEARLTVAGLVPPRDVDGVAALLAPLGDRVTWNPRPVPDADLTEVFAGATAVVLPYREFEAQSGVLHLAIEMGVPVVVSSAGGLAEVTGRLGIGEIVPELSPAPLATALRRVADPARHAALRDRVTAAQRMLSWEESAGLWWSALAEEAAR